MTAELCGMAPCELLLLAWLLNDLRRQRNGTGESLLCAGQLFARLVVDIRSYPVIRSVHTARFQFSFESPTGEARHFVWCAVRR